MRLALNVLVVYVPGLKSRVYRVYRLKLMLAVIYRHVNYRLPASSSALVRSTSCLSTTTSPAHGVSLPIPDPSSIRAVSTSHSGAPRSSIQSPLPTSSIQPPSLACDLLPPLDIILNIRFTTLPHVPKGAKDAWARCLKEVCESIVLSPDDPDPKNKLFMFDQCVLTIPVKGGVSRWWEALRIVHSYIRRWRDGDFSGLWMKVLDVAETFMRWR